MNIRMVLRNYRKAIPHKITEMLNYSEMLSFYYFSMGNIVKTLLATGSHERGFLLVSFSIY